MGKTVGVITMYRRNYGAFLQAYGLQKTLEHCGYEPELIRYDYYKDHAVAEVSLDYLKSQPVNFCKMVAVSLLRAGVNRKRASVFEASVARHLRESKGYYRTYRALENDPPMYDIYLTGSDQVFNPNLSPQGSRSRFLCFAKGVKASYAASSGTLAFPVQYETMMGAELPKFKAVSVREPGLRDYLREKLGIPADHHMDPSLLLDKEEWLRFGETDLPKDGYILFYRVHKQPELNGLAQRLSEELGLPIFVADGKDSFPNQIPRTGCLSPEQWVGAVANAAYVVTNSFHGTAFSVNLQKKAVVMLPLRGRERIEAFLNNCGLQRLLEPSLLRDGEMQTLYNGAEEYLACERKRSIEYLMSIGDRNENEF